MLLKLGVHLGLELAGQAVLILAYRHLCRHKWHRIAIWAFGTLSVALMTILIAG